MRDIAKIGSLFPRQFSINIKPPTTGNAVVKAGSPINRNGEVTSGADAVGLLRYDCNTSIGQRGVVVVSGRVDAAKAQEHCGIEYTAAVRGALPAISLIGIAEIPSGPNVATDGEVKEALDELFAGHK